MQAGGESDNELESRARAQAEAIFAAQALLYAQPPLLSRMGLQKAPAAPRTAVPKPGRELLLWCMKRETDLDRALQRAFGLLSHPGLVATVPTDRDCPILTYQGRRKWNDAAAEWAKRNDPTAQVWLRAERRLVLRRQGEQVHLLIERKDLDARFDTAEQKLVPVRVEGFEPVRMETRILLSERFPNVSVKALVDGLRHPTRAFAQPAARSRSAADAYVANAPLFVTNMEVYMQEKKKPVAEKEDPNKGFVTWLSNTLKAANNK